jgi:hypothetical protein
MSATARGLACLATVAALCLAAWAALGGAVVLVALLVLVLVGAW